MSVLKLGVVCVTSVLSLSLLSTPSFADDPVPYCHWYAHSALNQARAARANPSCWGLVNDSPSRWSMNYRDHFEWCLSVFGSGQNRSEHQARVEGLNQCVNL
jgi:hypothetical protein